MPNQHRCASAGRALLRSLVVFLITASLAAAGLARLRARPAAVTRDNRCPGPNRLASRQLGPEKGWESFLETALHGLEIASGQLQVREPEAPRGPLATLGDEVRRLQHEGRPYRAIAAAALAVRSYPASPLAYELLADALAGEGDHLAMAAAAARTATRLAPAASSAQVSLATALERQGRRGEARTAWQRASELAPADGEIALRHAAAAYETGQLVIARQELARARQLGARGLPQLDGLLAGDAGGARTAGVLPTPLAGVRVDTGGTTQAAETILATGDGQSLVAAWNDLRQAGPAGEWRLGAAASLDGGAHWTDTIVRAPAGLADDFEGDPITVHDPRTGNQWVGGILFGYAAKHASQLYLARRHAGSTSFDPAVSLHVDDFIDKALVAAGPRPGLPNTTRLYAAYNLGLQTSDDLGATWSPVHTLDGGIGLVPRVGPGGQLYIAYWNVGFDNVLLRSFDGGATFDPPITAATRLAVWSTSELPEVPGRFRVAPIPAFAVDPLSGTLYVVWADLTGTSGGEANIDLYFSRSTDQGSHWTTPRIINGDSTPPRDQFLPWLEVDATGRLHLIFFDTRSTPQLDADVDAFLDVYYATSSDHGDTWSELRVTPQPFESSLATWPGFEQFVGDYLGLTVAGDRVHLLYPTTANGNLDIYTQVLDFQALFADGFESGDTAAWAFTTP